MKLYPHVPIQINNKYNIKLNEVAVENKWNPDEMKKKNKNELRESKLLRLFSKTNMGRTITRYQVPGNGNRCQVSDTRYLISNVTGAAK